MAICNRFGAPVEIISAWCPKEFPGFWLVKAKRTGPYPDGSGQDRIGEMLSGDDKFCNGYLPIYTFRADEGAVEVSRECEAKATDERPPSANRILNYYWPRCFDKKGNWIDKAA